MTNWCTHIGFALLIHCKAKVSFALLCSAIALCKWRFKRVKLVVECQFFVHFDIFSGENADRGLFTNSPFARFAVRITRVVDKARHISVNSWVDDLSILSAHHVGARGPFIFLDSFLAYRRVFVENLSYILHDEGSFLDIFASAKPPAFIWRLDGVNMSVLLELEAAIAARLSDGTDLRHAVLGNWPI